MIRISDAVSLWAAHDRARIALIQGEERMSYGDLNLAIHAWRHILAGVGIARHDRVVIFSEKRTEMIAAFFAVLDEGAIAVPVNPQLTPRQLAHVVNDSQARFLITTKPRLAKIADEAFLVKPTILFLDQRSVDGPAREKRPVIDQDPAVMIYTSGSTGLPKGIVLSHRNLVAGAESVNTYLEHTAADVLMSVLPLSFDAGLSQLFMSVTLGASLVLVNYLTAREVAETAARTGVTSITAVPPLWRQLVATAWPDATRQGLRLFANTGGHMSLDLLQRLRDLFPAARPFLMYGLTEAFRSTFLDPNEVDTRPGSIGKAIPNAELFVLRPDGTPTDPDEPGELVHRGACVTLGYWKRPDLTALRFRPISATPSDIPIRDLAVWSGDIVKRDADGFLYFISRPEDEIKTSGYRVSPTEIEDVVSSSQLIEECVAFGARHPKLDAGVVLLVVLRKGTGISDVAEYCRRNLPGYMGPHHIAALRELPRNANGKLDRAELKHAYADTFSFTATDDVVSSMNGQRSYEH